MLDQALLFGRDHDSSAMLRKLSGLDVAIASVASYGSAIQRLTPARLSLDLVQVGIACQGVQPFWGEVVPSLAERVHDGVVA